MELIYTFNCDACGLRCESEKENVWDMHYTFYEYVKSYEMLKQRNVYLALCDDCKAVLYPIVSDKLFGHHLTISELQDMLEVGKTIKAFLEFVDEGGDGTYRESTKIHEFISSRCVKADE